MDVKNRVLLCSTLLEIESNEDYARSIGIMGHTVLKENDLQQNNGTGTINQISRKTGGYRDEDV